MTHEHSHHHHTLQITHVNKAFIVGIVLNMVFVVVEAIAGFYYGSLSLLSDAGHNLADVGTLALSLLAFRLLKIRPNDHYTYGYRKTSIIVALFNSVVLLFSVAAIAYEAIDRIFHPKPLPGLMIAVVAGVGILVNGGSAILFLRDKDKDLNIKSAYLHLLNDALVSLALVIGGIIMYYTHWYWMDTVLSIAVAVVILYSTWYLLKDSLRLSLDGVPVDIDINDIKTAALTIAGVKDVHHIHIWAISTTENALTAHLVLQNDATSTQEQKIKHDLKHLLAHKNIHHITLETERENEKCVAIEC